MLEKTLRIGGLFDFYQSLLTTRQRSYMKSYYLDDYSLGEIAEQFHVSRQAVYDTISRTEAILEDFEKKLSLYFKFQQRLALLDEMKPLVASGHSEVFKKIQEAITKLEELD